MTDSINVCMHAFVAVQHAYSTTMCIHFEPTRFSVAYAGHALVLMYPPHNYDVLACMLIAV